MYVLGIDPGVTGAIVRAYPNSEGQPVFDQWKMPTVPHGLLDWFDEYHMPGPGYAYVEFVGGFHVQPNSPMPVLQNAVKRVSANLKLREGLGGIIAVVAAEGLSMDKPVTPTKWMNWLAPGRPKGKDNDAKRKTHIHEIVCRRVPVSSVNNQKKIYKYAADAYGLALYGIEHCKHWKS